MFTKNLTGKEIVDIITAGNLANCSAISYNGLNVTYALKPDCAVVESALQPPLMPNLEPQAENHSDPAIDETIAKQNKAAHDLNTLLLTDPEKYEQLIHDEEFIDDRP